MFIFDPMLSNDRRPKYSRTFKMPQGWLLALHANIRPSWKGLPGTRNSKANGKQPKSYLDRVFNYKLGCTPTSRVEKLGRGLIPLAYLISSTVANEKSLVTLPTSCALPSPGSPPPSVRSNVTTPIAEQIPLQVRLGIFLVRVVLSQLNVLS
jgi:hypothetical protein